MPEMIGKRQGKLKKELIFLDIDGTLTLPGRNVPPKSALDAIRMARACGHKVFLCTGRNYDMLLPLLQYGFDGLIGSSGGYIQVDGKVIYDCPMTDAQRERVMGTLQRHGIYRTIECTEGSFTDEGLKEYLRDHAAENSNSELLHYRKVLEASLGIRPMAEYAGQPAHKVVMMAMQLEDLQAVKAELGEEFSIVIQDQGARSIYNGELIRKEFDKGQGVLRVCQYLHWDPRDTIGFGDSMNDLEMMTTVGTSVCMDNGSLALKQIADRICPSVEQDGILHAFRELGLVK